jgi:anti-anti-sigma factor
MRYTCDHPAQGCVLVRLKESRLEQPKLASLKQLFNQLLKEGHLRFGINFSDVAYMDSFSLASIISIIRQVRQHQGDICLYQLNDFNMRIIQMTKLDSILPIVDSEQDALQKLEPNGKTATSLT